MKHLKRNTILILLILIITLGIVITIFSSCATYKPARKVWNCQEVHQEIGHYDTSITIQENWMKGTTTIIHLQDDSCVIIWGKKCEFERDELLFATGEYWYTIGQCKYFLENEAGTLRYGLLDR